MPWVNGVYSRGYASWAADASSNLPLSATKFDTEDNDFAAGINNCLTKDGLSTPNTAMTWTLTNAQVLQLQRGSDGAVFTLARTNGSTNPQLQFTVNDNGGFDINATAGQPLQIYTGGSLTAAFNYPGGVTLYGTNTNSVYGAQIYAGYVNGSYVVTPNVRLTPQAQSGGFTGNGTGLYFDCATNNTASAPIALIGSYLEGGGSGGSATDALGSLFFATKSAANASGPIARWYIRNDGGMVSPALASAGAGTINAAGLYVNGVAVATTTTLANYVTTASLTTTLAGYVTNSALASALSPYLQSSTAAATYQTQSGMSAYAPKASPALTGTPSAPTAALGTNTTQLATTAFVAAANANQVRAGSFTAINGTVTVTFATAFPNAVGGVVVQWDYANPNVGWVVPGSLSTTGFQYQNSNGGNCYYIATGS